MKDNVDMNENTDETLLSIGEQIAKVNSGWEPRTPNYALPIDYAADEAAAWESEKPKVWDYMLARGVPPKFIGEVKAAALVESDALRGVELFLSSPEMRMLLLSGVNQVGKSLACAYGLSTRTVQTWTQFGGPQTEYMKSIGMPAEERRRWTKWDKDFFWTKSARIGALAFLERSQDPAERARGGAPANVGMCVIDEVGGDTWSDGQKKLDDLLGRRWDAGHRTMMTTNLDVPGFRDAVGDRIYERIRRLGLVIECKDFR